MYNLNIVYIIFKRSLTNIYYFCIHNFSLILSFISSILDAHFIISVYHNNFLHSFAVI